MDLNEFYLVMYPHLNIEVMGYTVLLMFILKHSKTYNLLMDSSNIFSYNQSKYWNSSQLPLGSGIWQEKIPYLIWSTSAFSLILNLVSRGNRFCNTTSKVLRVLPNEVP